MSGLLPAVYCKVPTSLARLLLGVVGRQYPGSLYLCNSDGQSMSGIAGRRVKK